MDKEVFGLKEVRDFESSMKRIAEVNKTLEIHLERRIKRIEEKIDNLEKAAFISLRGVKALMTLDQKEEHPPSGTEEKPDLSVVVGEIDNLLSTINKRNWPDFIVKGTTTKK